MLMGIQCATGRFTSTDCQSPVSVAVARPRLAMPEDRKVLLREAADQFSEADRPSNREEINLDHFWPRLGRNSGRFFGFQDRITLGAVQHETDCSHDCCKTR